VTSAARPAGRRWTPAIRKELRALLPAWLAAAAAMLLIHRPVSHGYPGYELLVVDAALASFFVGTALVASLAIGHEYLHGTVGSLLAQPRRRRDALLLKLAALLPLEIALGALFRARVPGLSVPAPLLAIDVLPIAVAITVAPWLTMACRSALAGTVFTVALLGAWWGTAMFIGSMLMPAALGIVAGGEAILCVVGAVMSWRTFMELEAVGSPGGESFLAGGRTAPAAVETRLVTRPKPRVWLVVRKELRLQLPALAVAALYVAGSLVFATTGSTASEVSQILYGIAPLYIGLMALLIGAVSSAEERQLGTAEWQVMLPMAAKAQWTIKVLVTLSVLAVLALAVPAVVLSIVSATRGLVTREAATTAVLFSLPLVLIGMYVSSLSRNSLAAFLAAAPTAIAVWTCIASFVRPAGPFGTPFLARLGVAPWAWLYTAFAPHGLSKAAQTAFARLSPAAAAVIVVAPLVAAVYFAMRNHRSAERGLARVGRQVAWMIALVVLATSVWDGVAMGRSWDEPVARIEGTRAAIRRAASGIDGDVGICALIRFRAACVNPEALVPMAGTWRLPVVIAALKAIDSGALQADDSVNAWLDRALIDDTAASNLARAVSGTPLVDAPWLRGFTRSLLVRDVSHLEDLTTPAQVAYLLEQAGTPDNRLLQKAPSERLRDLLTRATSTGGGLRAGAPAGWMAWDVPATSAASNGTPAAANDVGFLRAPDGTFIAVAVFLDKSHASAAERAAFFASVARAIAGAY